MPDYKRILGIPPLSEGDQKRFDEGIERIIFASKISALREALIAVGPAVHSSFAINSLIEQLQKQHPDFQENLEIKESPALTQIEDAEVIELTEVYGGFDTKNSNPSIEINTLEEAIEFLKEGKIAGFEIGNYLDDKWSPIGMVSKWDSSPLSIRMCQINVLKQQGSGIYVNLDTEECLKYMNHYVDLATGAKGGLVDAIREIKGMAPQTDEERAPKFKAL